MTRDEVNRKLAEKLGCWHEVIPATNYKCYCGYQSDDAYVICSHVVNHPNPDFYTPDGIVLLLREMMKNTRGSRFIAKLNGLSLDEDNDLIDNAIPIDYITDTTGKLAIAALEWLEKEGK